MNCPHCSSPDHHVLETRQRKTFIWRRRKCNDCGERFSTRERVVVQPTTKVRRKRFAIRSEQGKGAVAELDAMLGEVM
jgi:transcriptional regulator NrdR family protein